MDKIFKVFISSTYTDLNDIRKEIIDGVLRAGHMPIMMESFTANASQKVKITKEISSCDIYILILGSKYGSIDNETNLSYTEWEYDYAVSKGLPIYTMVLSDEFIHNRMQSGILEANDIETTKPEYIAFLKKVKRRLVDFVNNKEEIKSKIEAGMLQVVNDYGNNMIGWISGTIIEELDNQKREVEILRRNKSSLKVKLTDARKDNAKDVSIPANKRFDDLLSNMYQSRETDDTIEHAMLFIKSFVESKIEEIETKGTDHKGNLAMGFDHKKKNVVLFRLDPDSISFQADYSKQVIKVIVKISAKKIYNREIDILALEDGKLTSIHYKESLSTEYLNKILTMYTDMKND